MKNMIKEIIITLLLCMAILLVLSVIFYDYNPLNKIIPNKIAYESPNEIKQEIQNTKSNDGLDSEINIVYSIDSSDLNVYMRSKSYVPGKENPFATVDDNTAADGSTAAQPTTSGSSRTTGAATSASTANSGGGASNANSASATSASTANSGNPSQMAEPRTTTGTTNNNSNPGSAGAYLNTTGRK